VEAPLKVEDPSTLNAPELLNLPNSVTTFWALDLPKRIPESAPPPPWLLIIHDSPSIPDLFH